MASTLGGRPTPRVDRLSRAGLRRRFAVCPSSRTSGQRMSGQRTSGQFGRRRGRRVGRGPRLGLAAAFAILLSLELVSPAGAVAAGVTPTPSRSPAGGAGPGDPQSPADPGAGQQVPVAGLTSGPAATGRATLTVVLFDGDIVLVGGRGFSADGDVTVTAATTDLGGSATARAGADGRFILGFQVPAGFAGRVTVTARQGSLEASGSLDVVATEAAAPEATLTEDAPENPAPEDRDRVVSAPTSSAPSTSAPAATGAPAPAPAPSPATQPAPAGSGGGTGGAHSGLPWMSGVYPSHVLSQVLSFGNWRGRPNDVAHVFTVRTKGWSAMVEPRWPLDLYKGFQGKLVISQPTYPKGQGNNAACARGEYDEHWKKFGTFLKNNGRADSIVRIGWEFNGTFMYWHSDAAGTQFRDCFRRISTAIRSTDPEVKIDWTFNAHASPVPNGGSPWAAYPGDEYVDYVGIDSYDWYPASRNEAEWNRQCDNPNGLCYLLDFARQHGKKVGVGEWGVASCSRGGGGDNPFYIQKMYDTFMEYKDVMAYEAYFHDAAPGNVCSTIQNGGQNPKASATYKRLFGRA